MHAKAVWCTRAKTCKDRYGAVLASWLRDQIDEGRCNSRHQPSELAPFRWPCLGGIDHHDECFRCRKPRGC